jgi:hypothetical protein
MTQKYVNRKCGSFREMHVKNIAKHKKIICMGIHILMIHMKKCKNNAEIPPTPMPIERG